VAAEYGDEGIRGFTLTLDEKMGLHKYVFMCLGYPYYGQYDRERAGVMLIDQSLLYDEACIVTPDDISLMCPDVFHGAGIELPRHLDSLGDYRASVVSGKGWVEILSRRLARHKQEHPDEPYPIKSCLTLGEIKYRDEISSSAIKYVIHTNEEFQAYMQSISSDAIAWPPRTTI
jgi:hypothetical protein